MKKTYAYTISLLLILQSCVSAIKAQDTIYFPLNFRFGAEVSGPGMYFFDKNMLSLEGYFSYDLSESRALFFSAGYLDYKYSQYNYDYHTNGLFARTGMDFNLLKPQKSSGIYWAGIGLHYGLSRFRSEVPFFMTENYWGKVTSSVPERTGWAHFIEVVPGVRTGIFRNLSIGWSVSLRFMAYSGTGNDLRAIYIPGFGNGARRVSTGINYFISWNIPYRTKRVIIQPEPQEEVRDETTPITPSGRQTF